MKTRIRDLSESEIRVEGDYRYVKTLIERFPSGPLGLVSDGFNLWKLITEVLPQLKEQIMAREGGPVVFRPDSGDPVDIMAGTAEVLDNGYYGVMMLPEEIDPDYPDEKEYYTLTQPEYDGCSTPETKGVVELLWDIFGGTTNENGFKVLHPSVRVIYGDAINLERFNEINTRLEAKGFASTNWVAGIGSFTYQFNTRDTFGFAMKSTYQEVTTNYFDVNGNETGQDSEVKGINIFKDPITDDGTKKSAKGLLSVQRKGNIGRNGEPLNLEFTLTDECTWGEEDAGFLETIFENGNFMNQITLDEIRTKVGSM